MHRRSIIAAVAAALAASCSPAPAPVTPEPPPLASDPAPPPSAPSATTQASAAVAPAVQPPAFAAWTGVPAKDTFPAGAEPISDAEATEADKKCKPLQDALAAAAKKIKASSAPEAVLQALADPPKVKGVDVPRCADLIRRDLISYRAKTIESEAIQQLKRLAVAVGSGLDRQPRTFCPSAPPVPADVSTLNAVPHQTDQKAWDHVAWKCLGFSLATPQYFQFRYEIDEPSQTFVAVAKGFPVAGKPAVELFLRGQVDGKELKSVTEVMRKQ